MEGTLTKAEYFKGIAEVGQQISISNPDKVVELYLKDCMFSHISYDMLRAICNLKKDEFYKITDVCKSCKIVKIKVGKKFASIKYIHISKITS